jgi:hypothetical protein
MQLQLLLSNVRALDDSRVVAWRTGRGDKKD